MMANFEELWDRSRLFPRLFIGDGKPFLTRRLFDKEKAKELWANRSPKLNWDFCAGDSCITMVQKGQYCERHWHSHGKPPSWKWGRGVLWKYVAFRFGRNSRIRDWHYERYAKRQAERVFGKLPKGYRVFFNDGNTFNHRMENLAILSSIAAVVAEHRVLSVQNALELDLYIEDFVAAKFKGGRVPFRGTYGYGSIAKLAHIPETHVRKAIQRGKLEPESLESITKFVIERKNLYDEIETDEKIQG